MGGFQILLHSRPSDVTNSCLTLELPETLDTQALLGERMKYSPLSSDPG